MELFNQLFAEYGLKVAIGVFIARQAWDLIVGTTKKYVKAIDENTAELVKLNLKMEKMNTDLRVSFFNIKEIRTKAGLGPLTAPENLDQ